VGRDLLELPQLRLVAYHSVMPPRGIFRLFLADWITRWFHAGEADNAHGVQEARASFADVAFKWFSKQAWWLKETILQVHEAVIVLTDREKYQRLKKYKARSAGHRPTSCWPSPWICFPRNWGRLGSRSRRSSVGTSTTGWNIIVQKDQNWGTYLWMTWPPRSIQSTK